MTFLRDTFESNYPSVPRRRFNDETPFVGGMFPIPPGSLSTGTNVLTSVFAGIQDFQSGNYLGAISRTAQVGVIGAEAIESASNKIGGFILDNSPEWLLKLTTGKGKRGHRGSSPVGNVYTNNEPVLFQYFPENVQDQRDNNVEYIKPPGVSLPVPTLSSASARNISMTLTFARERWPGRQQVPATDQWDKYNFDVAASLQAIRRYTYPIGTSVFGLKGGITPQPFVLTLPGTRIGIDSDSIAAILTSYNIDYVAHFPDGMPRLARISLGITEILRDITQNVTGASFQNAVNAHAAGSKSAIQTRNVDDQDQSKGVYGITRKNDVSLVKSIPPQ